jgi:predicted ribosomally synthesized peptide with nif11-like leader
MSIQELQAFIEHIKIQDDPQSKQDIKNASAAQDLQAVVAMGKNAGFSFDESDIHEFHAQLVENLSDESLEQLSGGNASGWLAAGEEVIAVNRRPL